VGVTAENYRVRDVADIVGSVVEGSVVRFADGASPDLRNYRVTFDLLAETLPGFVPQWTVRRGVEELFDAYLQHGLTLAALTGPHLIRLERIRLLQSSGVLDGDLHRLSPDRLMRELEEEPQHV
jgi:hypothetical protein